MTNRNQHKHRNDKTNTHIGPTKKNNTHTHRTNKSQHKHRTNKNQSRWGSERTDRLACEDVWLLSNTGFEPTLYMQRQQQHAAKLNTSTGKPLRSDPQTTHNPAQMPKEQGSKYPAPCPETPTSVDNWNPSPAFPSLVQNNQEGCWFQMAPER